MDLTKYCKIYDANPVPVSNICEFYTVMNYVYTIEPMITPCNKNLVALIFLHNKDHIGT